MSPTADPLARVDAKDGALPVADRVLDLRRAGKSYTKIASRLGISASAARSVTRRAEKEFDVSAQGLQAVDLAIEIKRLETVTTALYCQIVNDEAGPNPRTIEAFLRASKQLVDMATPR